MLHPTQPARRALGPNGARFSITVSAKKTLGINRRFLISHSLEYCKISRLGTRSDRIERSIESYPASTTFFWFQALRLLSWKDWSHAGHTKSTAGYDSM